MSQDIKDNTALIKKLEENLKSFEEERQKLLPLTNYELDRRFIQYSNQIVEIKKQLKQLRK